MPNDKLRGLGQWWRQNVSTPPDFPNPDIERQQALQRFAAPVPIQQVDAQLRHQFDNDTLAETAMASQAPKPKFQQLRQKFQSAPQESNVRDTLKGVVEVTPELEQQLGYGEREEDETTRKPRQFSTPSI